MTKEEKKTTTRLCRLGQGFHRVSDGLGEQLAAVALSLRKKAGTEN
jgi:hypothetical protein